MATSAESRATDESFLTLFAPQLPPALQEIDVPSYVLDAGRRVRWLNDAGRRIVGDVVGRLFTVIEPTEAGRARARFAGNLRGEGHGDVTIDVLGRDGAGHRIEISSVPLRSGHRVIGMLGLALPQSMARTRVPRLDGRLTARQHDILEQLASGASTEQIAHHFHLSPETLRNPCARSCAVSGLIPAGKRWHSLVRRRSSDRRPHGAALPSLRQVSWRPP